MRLTWAIESAGALFRACAACEAPNFQASARRRVRIAPIDDLGVWPLLPPDGRRAASVRADRTKEVERGSRGDDDER
jgi:hypothetical protein